MNIDLSRPEELPERFIFKLRSIDELCYEYEFSEELVKHPKVSPIVRDLDEYCRNHRIIGIHYTRTDPEKIREKGLLIRSGKQIRANFLKEYGHIFSETEVVIIKEKWLNYFDSQQLSGRDGKIFFNFTSAALKDGGAEYLLGMYGGEQVNMCFRYDSNIGKKLRQIGTPLVVRCSLNPNQVNTFIENPWGKIVMSSYHLSQNSEAYRIDQDGYLTVPVGPKKIIEIQKLSDQGILDD